MRRKPALTPIKQVVAKKLDRKTTASRRGQGLGARRIQESDASRRNFDHAVAFEFGERAAHGLDGQAEEIRNVLAIHRQRHRSRWRAEYGEPVAPGDQESRDPFFRGTAAE